MFHWLLRSIIFLNKICHYNEIHAYDTFILLNNWKNKQSSYIPNDVAVLLYKTAMLINNLYKLFVTFIPYVYAPISTVTSLDSDLLNRVLLLLLEHQFAFGKQVPSFVRRANTANPPGLDKSNLFVSQFMQYEMLIFLLLEKP